MANQYVLGWRYVDKGKRHDPLDQFLGWLNIDGSGMLNTPGVRPFRYIAPTMPKVIPAYVILVTHDEKRTGNPWEDIVDRAAGRIRYWGDAKDHPTKHQAADFAGNDCLATIYNLVLEQKWDLVPPILHFSKPKKGVVEFNGLCVLDKLETTLFEDQGKPVKNFRCDLTILDEQVLDTAWLHERANSTNTSASDKSAPKAWQNYKAGKISRLRIWKHRIRTLANQIPPKGSSDDKILEQLRALDPFRFEAAVVQLFQQINSVVHDIHPTRHIKDGGFDFHGHFTLPEPLGYDIRFKGEVKRWSREQAVGPKDVSRLVARLDRGEYGIFVTTSYFTKAAQEEVLADRYPVKLLSGLDLVNFMKSLMLISNGTISPSWLQTFQKEPATAEVV